MAPGMIKEIFGGKDDAGSRLLLGMPQENLFSAGTMQEIFGAKNNAGDLQLPGKFQETFWHQGRYRNIWCQGR